MCRIVEEESLHTELLPLCVYMEQEGVGRMSGGIWRLPLGLGPGVLLASQKG